MKINDKVESELRGEVSKTFIILHFGLGPSNQLNSTTGLTLRQQWHHVPLKTHISFEW